MWSDKLCGQITYNLRQLGSQGAESFARGVGRLGRGRGSALQQPRWRGQQLGHPRLVTPLATHFFSQGQSCGFGGPLPQGCSCSPAQSPLIPLSRATVPPCGHVARSRAVRVIQRADMGSISRWFPSRGTYPGASRCSSWLPRPVLLLSPRCPSPSKRLRHGLPCP